MNFTELPECLQAAYQRQPRRRPFARSAKKQIVRNNFLAEANPRVMHATHSVSEACDRTSPLGGRNAKGAGAPQCNRNAAGGGLYRLCLRRMRLKQQLDRQHYQLLVLAAVLEHLQARAATAPQQKFSQNNYLAEATLPVRAREPSGPQPATQPATQPAPVRDTPSPPTPDRYNNYLARSLAPQRPPSRSIFAGLGPASPPNAPPDPSKISQIPSVKRLDVRIAELYG